VFTLGFTGGTSFSGGAGTKRTEGYVATLKHEGEGNNAQGWSYGVSPEGNAIILTLTIDGTDAKVLFGGGFNKTQIIDPAVNGGKTGGVSAVVLSLTAGTTLPAKSTSSVGKMDVELTIPDAPGTAKLVYVDGLKGAGQAVQTVITQDGNSVAAQKAPITISLAPAVTCCGKETIVGFSSEVIRGAGKEDPRIVGLGEDCNATGGVISIPSKLGDTGKATVFANISSNLADPDGVQGWSFGVELGGDADLVAVTTAGTAADKVENGGLFSGGFNKTQIIDPAKQATPGTRGGVSGVVLSLTEGTVLPFVSTESVLMFGLAAKAPQGEEPQRATLAFKNGLIGAGQPVTNVITVGGDSELACNFGTASVAIDFVKSLGPVERPFIRGNANDDTKVDIADAIWIINQLFRGGAARPCQDAADVNDDGVIDASDAVSLIDYLFKGQAAPSAPSPACGTDPTEDTLVCDANGNGC
jgi:hypothetical protein